MSETKADTAEPTSLGEMTPDEPGVTGAAAPVVSVEPPEPTEPRRPRVREEFLAEFIQLGRAIDNLLVAHHGLRAALKPGHPPWDADLLTGVKLLGQGPVFHLWNECRLVEALRIAWTGKGTTPAQETS